VPAKVRKGRKTIKGEGLGHESCRNTSQCSFRFSERNYGIGKTISCRGSRDWYISLRGKHRLGILPVTPQQ
jgi:hypothetical protein